MSRATVAIVGTRYANLSIEERGLKPAGVRLVSGWGGTEDELIEVCRDAAVVMAGAAPRFTARVIRSLPHLKAIVRYGIGVDTIDFNAASAAGVAVANVPDYCLDEVSTHAVALLLALHRKILFADRGLRSGAWGIEALRPIKSSLDTTVGVMGLGQIGRKVVAKLKPFGYKILGCDPHVDPAVALDLGIPLLSFDELLRLSDFVTLHVPLTDDTRHLISDNTLVMMKPEACVVNTSRGGLIDEAALLNALEQGSLSGAALDVFEMEPLPANSPLRNNDQVILTPHSSWYSLRSEADLRDKAVNEVIRVLRNEPLKHQVAVSRGGSK